MTLKELQQSNPDLYETDKGSHWHSFAGKSYLDHYETHFGPIKGAPGNILEIGVHHGGSVRLWRDYFEPGPGLVVGLDNLDVSWSQTTSRGIIILQGDQGNREDLRKVSANGPFKIVIDDGSHEPMDILTSFKELWPSVLPDGLYCIEDLQRPLELNTWEFLNERFSGFYRQLDARSGDIQAIHRYAHLILFQKVS